MAPINSFLFSSLTLYSVSYRDETLSYNYDPETKSNLSCLVCYLKVSTTTTFISPPDLVGSHNYYRYQEGNNPHMSDTTVPVLCNQLLSHFTAALRSKAFELGLSENECNLLVEQVLTGVMYWTARPHHHHAPEHRCRMDVPVIHVCFTTVSLLNNDDDDDYYYVDQSTNIRRRPQTAFGFSSDGNLTRRLKKVEVDVGGTLSVDGEVVEKDAYDCCSVCLGDLASMKEGDIDVRCLPCFHMFHRVCIQRWLLKSNTCPLCRFSPVV